MSRVRDFLRSHYHQMRTRLTQIRDTPHAIAGGVAIGLVCGFTPLLGFKTLLAVLIAWLCRTSKLSSALAVTFHDVLLPIWPVILRWQFQIGYYILYSPHTLPPKVSIKHFHYENFFSWKTLHVLWPTFVGSLVMATPIAIAVYFLVLEIVARANTAKARAAEAEDPPLPPGLS